jgi:hypothetical protein
VSFPAGSDCHAPPYWCPWLYTVTGRWPIPLSHDADELEACAEGCHPEDRIGRPERPWRWIQSEDT